MSGMHYRNSDNDFNECALDLETWPCPAAQAEAAQREARRAAQAEAAQSQAGGK